MKILILQQVTIKEPYRKKSPQRVLWYLRTYEQLSDKLKQKCAELKLEIAKKIDVQNIMLDLSKPHIKFQCKNVANSNNFKCIESQKIFRGDI